MAPMLVSSVLYITLLHNFLYFLEFICFFFLFFTEETGQEAFSILTNLMTMYIVLHLIFGRNYMS